MDPLPLFDLIGAFKMMVRIVVFAALASAPMAIAANTVHAPDARSQQRQISPALKPPQTVKTILVCMDSVGHHPYVYNVGPDTVPAHTKIHWQWQVGFHGGGSYEFSGDVKAQEHRKLSDVTLPAKASTTAHCNVPDTDIWPLACIGAIPDLSHVCKFKLEQSPIGYNVILKQP